MNPIQLADQFRDRGPLLHLVLDGWGVGPPDDTNALQKMLQESAIMAFTGSSAASPMPCRTFNVLPRSPEVR